MSQRNSREHRAWKKLKAKINRLIKHCDDIPMPADMMIHYGAIDHHKNDARLASPTLQRVENAYNQVIQHTLTMKYGNPERSMLHVAIDLYDTDFVRDLLEANADIHCTYHNQYGRSIGILEYTLWNTRSLDVSEHDQRQLIKILHMLLEKGANPNDHPKDRAFFHSYYQSIPIDTFKLFIQKGVDLSAIDEEANSYNMVHWCVSSKLHDHLKIVLENGGDLNAKDANGNTPLARAIAGYDRVSCRLLLEQPKINLLIKCNGSTARDEAAKRPGLEEIVNQIDAISKARATALPTQAPHYTLRSRVVLRSDAPTQNPHVQAAPITGVKRRAT